MAQVSPSSLLYAQALTIINQLKTDYASKKYQTPDEISTLINQAISKFNQSAGGTLTKYEPVYRSEIPLSTKMNRFWHTLQDDINILQDQIDVLNASAVFMHNFIKTDILQAQNENKALQNKLKTLELYSSVDDNSLAYFGDKFSSDDFIDWNLILDAERPTLMSNGLTLGVSQQKQLMDSSATTVQILEGSNGFLGNNQEIEDPTLALNSADGTQKLYTFLGETNRHSDLAALLDDDPTTWIEFEKYWVSDADRAIAKSFNFEYYLTGSIVSQYLTGETAANASETNFGTVSWADGIDDNVLRMNIEFDLASQNVVNLITFLPFGLINNKNAPIFVKTVSVSSDRTEWFTLNPENLWISNSIDKQISNINAEVINVGQAFWVNNNTDLVQFIRFEIQQPASLTANIGHLYYVTKGSDGVGLPNYPIDVPSLTTTTSSVATATSAAYDDAATSTVLAQASTNRPDAPFRRLGPIPPIDNPLYYNVNASKVSNDLIQKREFFVGNRWAIGVRDISAYSNMYQENSKLVSKRFDIAGIVDRVALEADIQIPSSYDSSQRWVKFYVSPDNGTQWFEIARVQDDFEDVPEIIAFNDPTPQELREPGVAYQDVSGTVTSLRLKIEITRPEDSQSLSPVIKSYKLKVVKRG